MIGNRADEAITLQNIGVVYANQGLYDQARANFQPALVIARKIGKQPLEKAIHYAINELPD